jgi:hypothetical protein
LVHTGEPCCHRSLTIFQHTKQASAPRPTTRRRNKNLGDGIDYGQQHYECLGELISDTLQLLERSGGEDATINIKYMVPTFESGLV